jgi:energy-coupling factor transporter transmembrane protein EcfT
MGFLYQAWSWFKYIAMFLAFLSLLFLTGSISRLIRGAKDGLKEMMNPLGFIVFIILIIIAIVIYNKVNSLFMVMVN